VSQERIHQQKLEIKVMRSRAVLLVSLLALALPLTVLATSPANARKVTFTEPVTVGNTVLNAGNYKVKWDGGDSAVQVSFLQGNKTVATVPATVVSETNPFLDGAVQIREQKGNAKVLKKILWKSVSLNFDEAALAQGK
jgi:hypothetical protein